MDEFERPNEGFDNYPASDAAPPTHAGDFVPVAPPEGWPTVIAVLSIIFASLAILGASCGLGSMLLMPMITGALPAEAQDEMNAQMQSSMPYPAFQALQQASELIVAIILLVGGIKLLKRNPGSGRILTVYAVLDLLSNTYIAVVTYFVVTASMAAMQNDPNMPQSASGMLGIMQSIGPIIAVIGWVFTAFWPIFLIWWFRRPRIQNSMAAWG